MPTCASRPPSLPTPARLPAGIAKQRQEYETTTTITLYTAPEGGLDITIGQQDAAIGQSVEAHEYLAGVFAQVEQLLEQGNSLPQTLANAAKDAEAAAMHRRAASLMATRSDPASLAHHGLT